jgi:hypothetical protein
MPRMTFGVGFLYMRATDYGEIAKAIEAGKIQVKMNPGMGNMAQYTWNVTPGLLEVTPATSQGLIIHECTHAIFDMLKLTTRVEQSEGFAYLAQCLFDRLTNGGPPASPIKASADYGDIKSWGGWQLIWDESTSLAGKLATSGWIDESEAADLYAGIRAANYYKARVGKVEINDGI